MRKACGFGLRGWRARILIAALGLVAVGTGSSGAQVGDQVRLLDNFEQLGTWTADASDGVKASARSTAGVHGRALRLDFRKRA